jgi:hypothetical protein
MFVSYKTILAVICLVALVVALAVYGVRNYSAIRWRILSRSYKAKVLAKPTSENGEFKHVEWVTKQMTWECAADEYKPAFHARPDEYVRFRYVEEPHCFDVESARNLCAELRSIGKPVVLVDFKVWGKGYNIVAVEGRPVTDVGGWGNNGSNDFTSVCPIDKVIDGLSSRSESGK